MASQKAPIFEFDYAGDVHFESFVLLDPTTHDESTGLVKNTGGTDFAAMTRFVRRSAVVVNGSGGSVTFTWEGSDDKTNWSTINYGTGPASSGYTNVAITLAASGFAHYVFPVDDYYRFIRANVSAANASGGTKFTVCGISE